MDVYIVVLEDPYAAHFMGVYATKEAAQRYIEMHFEHDDCYVIMKRSVQNWFVKASDQVQTLVQLLPPTEGGYLHCYGYPQSYCYSTLQCLQGFGERPD
jgi:hypothetical protein